MPDKPTPQEMIGCGCDSGAIFSEPVQTYRYVPWRVWDTNAPLLAWIGLNPSTADAHLDDPTIRRCKQFAKDWHFGGIYMLNLYAWRATDPKRMLLVRDPVGRDNDDMLVTYCKRSKTIVAAWGANAEQPRANAVIRLLGGDLWCLGLTKGGAPRHPLYMHRNTQAQRFMRCLQEKEGGER